MHCHPRIVVYVVRNILIRIPTLETMRILIIGVAEVNFSQAQMITGLDRHNPATAGWDQLRPARTSYDR